ncbi:MAG: undecaprenyl-phosphate glucose phosphotransferase [Phyllobacterium sp.]
MNVDPQSHAADNDTARIEASLKPIAQQAADQYRGDTVSTAMVAGIMRIVDFLMVAAPGLFVYFVYVGASPDYPYAHPTVVFIASALTIILLSSTRCYRLPALRHPLMQLGRFALVWASVFAFLVIVAFFLKVSEEYSRLWIASWFIAGFVLLVIGRLICARLIRRWSSRGVMERRAVIVGGGPSAEELIRSLEQQPDNDIRICGIFDDRDEKRSPLVVAGYPKLGNISELIEFARIAHIDMLIVSLPLAAETRVLQLLKRLWVLPVDIRLSALNNPLRFRPRAYSYVGSVPMLDIFDRPINDWDSVAKRAFDIIFSLFGLILFSPVMLATAVAIKLDSKGPVIFMQKRHGFNNEIIQVWKFRSMYTDQSDPTARKSVTKNDPRVTRVGRFIRKASIDELPQFFNVLAGSLSLVGPRPHAVAASSHNLLYNEVVEGYFARHRVKPGVTGWAQINGWRGEVDTDDKIKIRTEFDLYYIENWSLWFDLKILLLTPIRLLNTENAY